MMDDSMSNVLCKYLEGVITMQDKEIQALLKERGDAEGRVIKKDEVIETLMKQINLLSKELQATRKACDQLEEDLNDSELEVLGLKDQRELNHSRIQVKDNIIVGLQDDICGAERFIKRLETECLAIAIQAAEAEDRADKEKRGRLQLVMRM